MISGRLEADPYRNYMAVSKNCGFFFVGVFAIGALLLEVYIRAPDCWNLPYEDGPERATVWTPIS